MNHTRFDLDGALESAGRASALDLSPRYVVLKARGWDIELTAPEVNVYGYFQVNPDATINVTEAPIDVDLSEVKLNP